MPTLADQLKSNTTERRKVLSDDDWDVIDGSITDLKATGI
jgi:hypothetical protein